jgi:hypothetical protein
MIWGLSLFGTLSRMVLERWVILHISDNTGVTQNVMFAGS